MSNDALGTDAADFLCFGCLPQMCVYVCECVECVWVVRPVATHLHFTGLLRPELGVASGPQSIDL